jgi:hypothetical protein
MRSLNLQGVWKVLLRLAKPGQCAHRSASTIDPALSSEGERVQKCEGMAVSDRNRTQADWFRRNLFAIRVPASPWPGSTNGIKEINRKDVPRAQGPDTRSPPLPLARFARKHHFFIVRGRFVVINGHCEGLLISRQLKLPHGCNVGGRPLLFRSIQR